MVSWPILWKQLFHTFSHVWIVWGRWVNQVPGVLYWLEVEAYCDFRYSSFSLRIPTYTQSWLGQQETGDSGRDGTHRGSNVWWYLSGAQHICQHSVACCTVEKVYASLYDDGGMNSLFPFTASFSYAPFRSSSRTAVISRELARAWLRGRSLCSWVGVGGGMPFHLPSPALLRIISLLLNPFLTPLVFLPWRLFIQK